jgi:hypothetical protein
MARFERGADFAVGLEAADPRTVACPRVDDDKWPLGDVDIHALGRDDSNEAVVDRPLQLAAVNKDLELVVEDMGNRFGCTFSLSIATLPHDVPEQEGPLRRIDHIFGQVADLSEWRDTAGLLVFLLF